MGYRSDIALCLSTIALAEFHQQMNKIENEGIRIDLNYLLSCRKNVYKDSNVELWYWEAIKWYSNYPEIDFIENFLMELDEDVYLFIRIGESDDDSEIMGCYWDNPFGMYLSRVIVLNPVKEFA